MSERVCVDSVRSLGTLANSFPGDPLCIHRKTIDQDVLQEETLQGAELRIGYEVFSQSSEISKCWCPNRRSY